MTLIEAGEPNTTERELDCPDPAGSRNDVQAWASKDGTVVLHPDCRKGYAKSVNDRYPKSMDVFIHDRRSKYISRFQCCSHCREAI